MLKLEKVAKTNELSVLVRVKPTLLTTPFLLALSYALFVHTAAFFIFQISPFRIGYQQSLFPPVRVATEVPFHDGVYATNEHFEEEEPIAPYLIAPSPFKPQLPTAQAIPIIRNTEYIKQKNPLSNPFLSLEKLLEIDIDRSELASSSVYIPLSVQLSGSLADLSFEFGTLDKIFEMHREQPYRTYHFLFSAQLDQKNGELFWWDLKVGENDTQAENYALDILRGLRFTPKIRSGFLSGEVSIALTLACNEFCHD